MRHPRALWILALTELCERFAFWGVGNLLVLYTIEFYQFPEKSATSIYGIFSGCAAFLPFLGGFIADRWNYHKPILLGAFINAAGCFMLSLGTEALLYPSLVVIALGYGLFTPSIITVLSHFYKDKPQLRETGFSIYYASINVGVFLALATLGTIAKYIGWNAAFFTAGCVQILGLIPIFIFLKHHKEDVKALTVNPQEKPLTRIDLNRLKVFGVFCLVSILFWMAYNQAFSSMEIFVHDYMHKGEVPEGVYLSSESFFLILLAPLLAVIYKRLQKRKMDPSPALKTSFGLFFLAACFALMTFACRNIPSGATHASVSPLYLIASYFLMAVGEMLLAPIGLSMFSRLSPPKYRALSIGVWYVCVGLAFYNGGLLAGFMHDFPTLASFFSLFIGVALVPALFMLFLSKKLTKLSHFK